MGRKLKILKASGLGSSSGILSMLGDEPGSLLTVTGGASLDADRAFCAA